ncbi:fatty acid cis/trans isomerase [Variovorax dokdonensis]|uniref:Fatty acid cis/trans isomerase n=1 Tax=Variovorax dokdonensis TaxID=344883 RepID=A0ABT7NFJ4_9BURK|nr:fatty acid cis/trans isomerase [Variovorax dokdonensis]MDM0046725.1 fatty acid cis/trans isomerase [Variovorax dokdonensis]
MRRLPFLLALLILGACAGIGVGIDRFTQRFGPADPQRFDHASAPMANEVSYDRSIQPLLDKRCVVCHACYDAPCQLKTTSWEGIARGASKVPVYDATRLVAAEPSRLFVDAAKASEWRDKGFFPVLNEHADTSVDASRTAGLMHRMLALKQAHPQPSQGVVTGDIDFSIDRAQSCPAGSQIDAYEKANPQGGMPFGLPGLSSGEHALMTLWLEQGAKAEPRPEPSPEARRHVARWERFFNGDSLKEQLFARYAYEHLFLAHLYFDEAAAKARHEYFKLVRSITPPGEPVREVAARRPVDDPGVARVYYRLVPERESIVAKTHMPYRLDDARMARWRSLFLAPAYEVEALPGYDAQTAANPFKTFAALPVGARYTFMLDEAEFTIMGFIKGPVCRGQLALDVIDDRFWVFFLAPSQTYDESLAAHLSQEADLLRLPTGSSNTGLLAPWRRYARMEKAYLALKSEALTQRVAQSGRQLDLSMVWDGEGRNPNAALTVLRHFDSASVVKGLVGDTPKTAWVIGYPLLERIHYLLVANYDVYGNVGHQLNSRLYMDFLRMEGEFNFLVFLPRDQREAVRDAWYRGDSLATREQVYGGPARFDADSGIRYRTADAKTELLDLLRQRMQPLAPGQFASIDGEPDPALREQLQRLAGVRGAALQWAAEAAILAVDEPGRPTHWYSLLRDNGHESVSYFLREKAQLRPEEDRLTVVPGILGSYPNAFYRVPATQLPAFVAAMSGLKSQADYSALAERFAVRRTDPRFWAHSDALAAAYAKAQPLSAGILDYNRLENR